MEPNNNLLDITGERLTIGKSSPRNQADHIARYEFAAKYVANKDVLDIACGTGYGVGQMCQASAAKVIGVDIDSASILHAKSTVTNTGASFVCARAGDKIFSDESFDVIVSFETIEHLSAEERANYLKNMYDYLRSDGVLILSTPNKRITSPWSKKPLNPYHVLEFFRDTLDKEISTSGFFIKEWYGQRYVSKILLYRLSYLGIRLFEKIFKQNLHIYEVADGAEIRPWRRFCEPRYFLIVAKKSQV